MPFNLSQIFGGWRRKDAGLRRVARPADEISRRGRAPEPRSGDGRDKEVSDAGREAKTKGQSEPARPARLPIGGQAGGLAWRSIVAPHVSEKATMLGERKYVFKITDGVAKQVLRRAIEDRYGVEVLSINTIQARSKKRMRGAISGKKTGFKKAVVTLKEGQSISEF